MTSLNPLAMQSSSPNSGANEGMSLFGSSPPSQDSSSQSASKQLISEVASVHSSLKGLAEAYPDMSEAVESAIEALKQGMTRAIGGMQSRESEGSQPTYA